MARLSPNAEELDGQIPESVAEPILQTIFESLPHGIVVFDGQLRGLMQNDAAGCMLADGVNVAEALAAAGTGQPAREWASALREVLATRRPRRFEAVRVRTPVGVEAYWHVICAPLRPRDPQVPVRGLLMLEDVSAQLGMEQRLAVAERLASVGKLCASVAHELSNPLDGLMRYLHLAQRASGGDANTPLAGYLRAADEAAARMVQVIRGLLEFARTAPAGVEAGNVNRIVEESVRTLEDRASQTGIAVVCHFQERDMPLIYGSSLFQVCCNLIRNAIDAMAGGGTLTIRTAVDESEVVLRFEDTGPGLPAEPQRLFEPFFTTKPPGQGTGLGLAVCRELVEKYGGRIMAANREDGPGAVFTVRIPLRPDGPATRAEGRAARGASPR